MKIQISLYPNPDSIDFSSASPRVRQLMQAFISERYTGALMEQPEIQKAFIEWFESRSARASKKTMRYELKAIQSVAEAHPKLGMLAEQAERVLLDTRNTVTNKSVKTALSRLINLDFIQKLTRASKLPTATESAQKAYTLFAASMMTGLRPGEWKEAQLITTGIAPGETSPCPFMVVRTLKTKGGAEVRDRILVLEDFSDNQVEVIREAIAIGRELTASQLGQCSISLRKLAVTVAPEALDEVINELELKTSRSLYTVEALREGRSKREVAAALGHTTIVNLRWYAHGETGIERQMPFKLARCVKGAEDRVRDTLKALEDARASDKAALDARLEQADLDADMPDGI